MNEHSDATTVPPQLLEKARAARKVVIFTGAGMSAESGVPTYRDARTGLWAKYDPMTLATPAAWREAPARVWAWYLERSAAVRASQPNMGHHALSFWGRSADVHIVTQNVDDLHERAGSPNVVHLHGSLFAPRCDSCAAPATVAVARPGSDAVPPPTCACGGLVRPGIVMFGERLPQDAWLRAVVHATTCDLMLVVGTDASVHPAAQIPELAIGQGTFVAEVNPRPSMLSSAVHLCWRTTAATGLPELVRALRRAP